MSDFLTVNLARTVRAGAQPDRAAGAAAQAHPASRVVARTVVTPRRSSSFLPAAPSGSATSWTSSCAASAASAAAAGSGGRPALLVARAHA
jgi:hypothetical protein